MLRALLPTLRTALPRPMVARTAAIAFPARPQAVRFYAASAGLSKDDITKRVMDVLKEFEKVDGVKVSPRGSYERLGGEVGWL
jgi:NADH dehydrogenase (ubiquinone) 1 alpha/beta subcomplex 1